MKNKIKQLLRESLLVEADNRQKIIKFGGSPELADWAHNISDKYSIWIANAALGDNERFNDDTNFRNRYTEYFKDLIDFIKIENKPSIDLKNKQNPLIYITDLLDRYKYITDWIDNPNVPYENLKNMTWDEAEQKAIDWHNSLEANGNVDNILGDNSELIHKFSDGYSWVLTKSNYCDASQKSMGHCATATNSDMYLLRLIKGNEEFITADWHPTDKYIIQLKGKQNNKPIPKYHPYIMWLLIDSGMVGELRTDEGYSPKSNFQLSDLSPEKLKIIVEKRPDLLNDEEIIYDLLDNSNNQIETAKILGPKILGKITNDGLFFNLIRESEHPIEMVNLLGVNKFNENKTFNNQSNIYSLLYETKNLKEMGQLLGPDRINMLDADSVGKLLLYTDNYELMKKILGPNNFNKLTPENQEYLDMPVKKQPVNENYIRKILRESLLTKTNKDIKHVADFVNFAKDFLSIDDDIKIALAFKRTPDLKTTAYYDLNGFVKVYVKDRAIIDVCRSIAHELVHHKQNLDGKLTDSIKDGSDGSDIENEANAVAGKIIRIYGKQHPELYV